MAERTDREIVAHLRRELRHWQHAEDCRSHDGFACSCGLDRIRDLLWPHTDSAAAEELGWQPGKFFVRHHDRGDLVDGEAMVLVPDRDPAAVPAIVAYAQATPDAVLADQLLAWVRRLNPTTLSQGDPVPSWVRDLAQLVRSGRMSVETSLFRIAGLARGESR